MTIAPDRTETGAVTRGPNSPAAAYDAVAQQSAALVIRRYSSSFGLASRLLAEPVRGHVRNVYALVRVADEIVDAPRPGHTEEHQRAVLDELEQDVERTLRTGHSANLVVHAFGLTARHCGITPDLTAPFFDSMRTDLTVRVHDQESLERYVYGSAEVVGLMCLRAFLRDEPDPESAYAALTPGARALGSAFQKVNFLRDLAEDAGLLGRRYFPGVDPARFTDAERDRLLDEIEGELAVAQAALAGLPPGSRRAVAVAHGLFAELARRLRATPAAEISRSRVRVPGPVKARIAARTLLGRDS